MGASLVNDVESPEPHAMDAVTQVPAPANEPVKTYAPGSPERAELESTLKRMASEPRELTMTIGGEQRFGGGEPIDVVQPHNRHHVLGTMHGSTHEDARAAVDAAHTDPTALLEKYRKHQDEIAALRANLKSELEKALKN